MTTEPDIHPQTLDPRRAGQLTRYHTWPRLREQSVGEHTWQLMRIVLAVWPAVPQEVLVYLMFHDVGEVVTGDLPYPVKAGNPQLRDCVEAIDAWACREMGDRFMVPAVREPWWPGTLNAKVFKMCEMTEMWEWGLHEMNLGNRYAALVAQRCWAHMVRLRDQLAEKAEDELDLREVISRFDAYTRKRSEYEEEVRSGADSNV